MYCTNGDLTAGMRLFPTGSQSWVASIFNQCLWSQQKKSCSLVLKVKKWAVLFFRVLTGIYNTVYCSARALFKKWTRNFFQREASSEAVVIAIVEADPLAKIVSVYLFNSLYTYWDLRFRKLHKKRDAPILSFPLLQSVFLAVSRMAINNTNVTFLLK